MYRHVLGFALASLVLGCSDDGKTGRLPPESVIDDKPAALSNQRRAVLAFHALGDADHFTCALDAAAEAPCSSPYEADVADGAHTFVVRAAIGAVTDETPASYAWKVDTVAPDTAITAAPPVLDNAAAPALTFEGSDDQGAVTLECALDDAAFAACSSPATLSALTDGSHTFHVRAIDGAGNIDPTPATATWTLDSRAPDTMIVTGPAAGAFTKGAVSFELASPDSPVTFECALDDAAFAACTSPQAYTGLAEGPHTFAARALDAAGLADPSPATRAWTVDTTAPAVTITSGPPALTNNRTPSFGFTVTGATTIECQVDTGAFAACSSPFTTAMLADGSHAFVVRGTDAAGNTASQRRTFAVDATPPVVAIDDAPPALWPVNYFDLKFHTTDATASLTCARDGAAFTPCASPLTITTAYNVPSSFAVRATDAAGNVTTTAPVSWTAQNGVVLHYPWEHGETHNTSLLAQKPAYSPDGTATLTAVGGWAGAAASSPAAHTYKATIRPLSSSANGQYTASVWVRVAQGSNGGLVFSNLAANNGLSLSLVGRQVQLVVHDNGQSFTASGVVPPGQWVQVAVITTGPSKGVQLLIDGAVVGTAAAPTSTGFGAGQAADLTVGTVFDVDVDDLRFYNRALSSAERCTVLVRGQLDANGGCVPLAPGLELAFERHQIVDTGTWNLPMSIPAVVSFLASNLGDRVRIDRNDQQFGYTQGFAPNVLAAPGHSFSFWFVAGAFSDTLFDFLHPCSPVATLTCGIRVQYAVNTGLVVLANGGATNPFGVAIPVAAGLHSVVVTEQKADANGTTARLSIYVDGALTTLPIGTVNVYAQPSDTLTLPQNVNGTQVDEYQFWPRDLSADPEMLCENGWDGEWNPATATCLLTAN